VGVAAVERYQEQPRSHVKAMAAYGGQKLGFPVPSPVQGPGLTPKHLHGTISSRLADRAKDPMPQPARSRCRHNDQRSAHSCRKPRCLYHRRIQFRRDGTWGLQVRYILSGRYVEVIYRLHETGKLTRSALLWAPQPLIVA